MQGNPTPGEEPPHDVLAAEAFAVPASDPDLRHGPMVLPRDPSGIDEPHDVLAAEEFAMPAVYRRAPRGDGWAEVLYRPPDQPLRLALWAMAGALTAALLARLLQRRH